MLTTDLFNRALLEPIVDAGADELLVVTGYSNALMARRHLDHARTQLDADFNLRLIVGMTGEEGIDLHTHEGLARLQSERPEQVTCSYAIPPHGVHSKLYVWRARGRPVQAWLGSANYTQRGFGLLSTGATRHEVLTQGDVGRAYEYFREIEALSIFVNHGELESTIRLTSPSPTSQHEFIPKDVGDGGFDEEVQGLDSVVLPLYSARDGAVPSRSGLNWGQREGRNQNQAYIPIPKRGIGDSEFFPPRGAYFTVKTDDGKELIFTRAQDEGKALHTPSNNALLGEYFRNRIGAASGQRITREMLRDYGADSVIMYKADDEQYFLDFSPRS